MVAQIWLQEYNEGQFTRDAFSLGVGALENVFGNTRALAKYAKDEVHYTVSGMRAGSTFIAINSLQQIIIGILLFKRRNWFARRRTTILVIHFLMKIIVYYSIVMRSPVFMVVQPLAIPTSARSAALHLGFVSLVLARMSISFMTPFASWYFVNTTGIIILMYNSWERCAQELAAIPGQGQRYKEIAAGAEMAFYRFLPLPPGRTGIFASLLASGLSERGACLATKNWLQVSELHCQFSINLKVFFLTIFGLCSCR